MSRTIRNESFHPAWFRRPRGWRQAKVNNVRHGAIPPHAWYDEKVISDEACKCMERERER